MTPAHPLFDSGVDEKRAAEIKPHYLLLCRET
jgi:hypothetical protein